MTKKYVLAHDFGTSGDKACLFDIEGNFIKEAYYPIKTYYPAPGRSEQKPEEWWQAVKDATNEVVAKSKVPPKDIAALSFSSHGMTAIPIDKEGNLLLDSVMTWMDARSTKEAEHILNKIGERERYLKTGNSFDVALYPAAKLLWIKRNLPEIYNKTVKFLNPKEYLAYKMTGLYKNTDYGDAGMSGLFNLHTHSWDKELLEISEIDEDKLLIPADNTTPVGYLTEYAAKEMGLTTNTLVVLGSWDNYACALGAGVRKKGTAVTCLGTAGWVAINGDKPLIADGIMSNVVYVGEDTYFTSVHSHSACVAYEWVLDNMCAGLKAKYGKGIYDKATGLAEKSGAGANGIFFLPSMFSGNTFYSDSSLAGSFVGLKMHNTEGDIIRAAMEGPAFDLMLGVDFFKAEGAMPGEASLIGGGANNRLWMQILSDMFLIKMNRPENIQYIGALGAALIAGVGAGLIKSLDVASDIIKFADCGMPEESAAEKYKELLPAYKKFYEGLMPAYKKLNHILDKG